MPAKASTGNAAAPEPILLDDDPEGEDVDISSSSPDEGRQPQPASQATQPPQVQLWTGMRCMLRQSEATGSSFQPLSSAQATERLWACGLAHSKLCAALKVGVDDAVTDAKPEAAAKPTLRLPPAPIFASARKGSKTPVSTTKPKEEAPAAAAHLERVPASRQPASGPKAARQVLPDRSAEVRSTCSMYGGVLGLLSRREGTVRGLESGIPFTSLRMMSHGTGGTTWVLSLQVPADAVLKSVKEYQPVEMAIWGQGQPAPYLHIGRALAAMDSTTKRLRISDVIANMFRSLLALSPGEALQTRNQRLALVRGNVVALSPDGCRRCSMDQLTVHACCTPPTACVTRPFRW